MEFNLKFIFIAPRSVFIAVFTQKIFELDAVLFKLFLILIQILDLDVISCSEWMRHHEYSGEFASDHPNNPLSLCIAARTVTLH